MLCDLGNNNILNGAEIIAGDNINIPKDNNMLDIIKSITKKGIYNKNAIWNADFNSEIINDGMMTEIGILS